MLVDEELHLVGHACHASTAWAGDERHVQVQMVVDSSASLVVDEQPAH
jgi:hypothetical protein